MSRYVAIFPGNQAVVRHSDRPLAYGYRYRYSENGNQHVVVGMTTTEEEAKAAIVVAKLTHSPLDFYDIVSADLPEI